MLHFSFVQASPTTPAAVRDHHHHPSSTFRQELAAIAAEKEAEAARHAADRGIIDEDEAMEIEMEPGDEEMEVEAPAETPAEEPKAVCEECTQRVGHNQEPPP